MISLELNRDYAPLFAMGVGIALGLLAFVGYRFFHVTWRISKVELQADNSTMRLRRGQRLFVPAFLGVGSAYFLVDALVSFLRH